MKDYYCEICDRTINRKSKTKHIKFKGHSHMNSYVVEKHTIDDVCSKDLEIIIFYYVNNNRSKFPIFKTLIECELYGKNINSCSDMNKTGVQLYSFDDSIFNFMFRVSKKKILYYIRHSAMMIGKEIFPESIIKNLSITFF